MQRLIQAKESAVGQTVARSGARGRAVRRGTEEARTQRTYFVPTALPELPKHGKLTWISVETDHRYRNYVDRRGFAAGFRRAAAAWLKAHGKGRRLIVSAVVLRGNWPVLASIWNEETGQWSDWAPQVTHG